MGYSSNARRRGPPGPGATLADWALAYAVIGWPTVLVHGTRTNGRCRCYDPRCDVPGAHAITEPMLDPVAIRNACELYPDANLAVHLRGAGLACIGINTRRYGPTPLAWFEKWHGLVRGGIVAEGGGGGTLARFYQAPPPGMGLPGVLPLHLGIVVTCGDACALVPPSRHPAGGRWAWPAGMCPWAGFLHPLPERLQALPWGDLIRAHTPDAILRTLHPEAGIA